MPLSRSDLRSNIPRRRVVSDAYARTDYVNPPVSNLFAYSGGCTAPAGYGEPCIRPSQCATNKCNAVAPFVGQCQCRSGGDCTGFNFCDGDGLCKVGCGNAGQCGGGTLHCGSAHNCVQCLVDVHCAGKGGLGLRVLGGCI